MIWNRILGLSLMAVFGVAPLRAVACDIALLMAVDVSSSIDAGEYRLQVDGMADALLDAEIGEALVAGQMALSVVQWSGVGNQAVVQPWVRMNSRADVIAFSQAARNTPRAYVNSDTAIGDAIRFASGQFGPVADCKAKVIDVSGDGTENSGTSTRTASRAAANAGILINGIAIESLGLAITGFFRLTVITQNGFVITARRHEDYPRAIREKILREVSKVTG